MAVLHAHAAQLPPTDVVLAHLYATCMLLVVFHHSVFADGKVFRSMPAEARGASLWLDTYAGSRTGIVMPAFALLAGVHDLAKTRDDGGAGTGTGTGGGRGGGGGGARAAAATAAATAARLAAMLWLINYSNLPYVAMLVHDKVFEIKKWPLPYARLVAPAWFLFALLVWRLLAAVAARLRVRYAPPLLATLAHFLCFGDGCPYPFKRWPLNKPFTDRSNLLPRTRPPAELAYLWFWYAAIPHLLPRFPDVLPGERGPISGRPLGPHARLLVRVAWAAVALGLLCATRVDAPPGKPLTSGHGWLRVAGVPLDYSASAYGCAATPGGDGGMCPHRKASKHPWTLVDLWMDAASGLIILAQVVGAAACMPRSRVPLLTAAGRASLFIFVAHPYVGPYFDRLVTRRVVAEVVRGGGAGGGTLAAVCLACSAVQMLACVGLQMGLGMVAAGYGGKHGRGGGGNKGRRRGTAGERQWAMVVVLGAVLATERGQLEKVAKATRGAGKFAWRTLVGVAPPPPPPPPPPQPPPPPGAAA